MPKSPEVRVETLREVLRSSCPYIIFAFVNTTAATFQGLRLLQLWIYLDPGKNSVNVLNEVIGIAEQSVPGCEVEVLILNTVNARTRALSLTRNCLYVRDLCEGIFWKYLERVGLESRKGNLHPAMWRLEPA